ncbi:hypothetical protein [Mucisphaera sp.]|uniref:hypothetical protein n=1 Tax=Mucisphaera sp. TaxID=2913024 RepID=UPI003D1379DA
MAKSPPTEPEAPESLHEIWWTNLQVLYTKHRNKIAAGLFIAAAVFAGLSFYNERQRQVREDAWGRLATATSPASFRNVAEDHADRDVAPLASLYAADLLMAEVNGLRQADEAGADVEGSLAEAGRLYQQALDSSEHPLVEINARLGLASVAESRQAWDEAVRQYEAVKTLAGERFPFLTTMAEQRLAVVPQLREGVVIAASSILDELGIGTDAGEEGAAEEVVPEVSDEPAAETP